MRRSIFLGAALAVIAAGFFVSQAEAAITLVKGPSAAVYLISGRARYVFPSAQVYFSWFSDFSSVKGTTEETLAKYPIGGSVIYRPGARLLKLMTDPKVYAVEPGGVLRWVPSEAVAIALYGPVWIERLDVLDDAFFAAYRVGEPLAEGEFPDGYVARDATSGSAYLLWSGEKRPLSSDILSALRLNPTKLPLANLTLAPEGDTIGRTSTIVSVMNDPLQRRYGGSTKTDVSAELLSSETILDRGERGATLMRFALWVRETTSIKQLVVQVKATKEGDADRDPDGLVYHSDAGAARGNLEHIRLLRRGKGEPLFPVVELATDPSKDGAQILTFTGQATLRPGRHVLSLVADVNGDVGLNQGFSGAISLERSTFVIGNTQTKKVSPKAVSGPAVYTRTGTLAVSLGPESKGVKVVGGIMEEVEPTVFRIKNPRSEPVTVAQVRLAAYVDEGEGQSDFRKGSDEDDGSPTSVSDVISTVWLVPLSAPEKAQAQGVPGNGDILFVDLGWTIPPKTTYSVAVRALPKRGTPREAGPDRVAFDIEDATVGVLAYDQNKSQVEVVGRAPNGGMNPKSGIRFVAGGTLTVKGGGGQERSVFTGGRDVEAYTLQFTGSSEEDILIDDLSFDLTDAAAARSIDRVSLNYSTESGWETKEPAENGGSGYTYEKLGLYVPKGSSTEVTLLLRVKSAEDGGMLGDRIAFAFAPTSLKGKGKATARVFDRATLGTSWTNAATTGAALVVSESVLRASASAAVPNRQQTAGSARPVLRVRFTVAGNEDPVVERAWVRLQATDTGAEGEDLLELLARSPDKMKMVRADSNEVVARGGDVVVYDASARTTVSDASSYESDSGDWVKVSFAPDLRLRDAVEEVLFTFDTEGIAENPTDIQAVLLGGDDFLWKTSTNAPEAQTGSDVSRLPIPGPTIRLVE